MYLYLIILKNKTFQMYLRYLTDTLNLYPKHLWLFYGYFMVIFFPDYLKGQIVTIFFNIAIKFFIK